MFPKLIACLALTTVLTACFAQQAAVPPRNLVTFFDKCRAGGPVTVGYIGGSITAQNGWRPFTTKWLGEQFKGLQVKEVNAAIGGTGSMLGVFRFQKHVLQYDPDLVFVEFAVNDAGAPDAEVHATMEGIVRQAWKREKKPDLVFVYTTAHTLETPTARHQAVADAYGIPTVDFQQSIRALCIPGLIDWEVLAADRVHPNDWGHAIYAATLATFLKKQISLKDAVPPPATLPPATFSDTYETARLAPVTENVPAGWETLKPEGYFQDGSIMAKDVGQTIELKFSGTIVGVYYEIRQNGAAISWQIDGQAPKKFGTSWGPTYKFNRQNCVILTSGLPKGDHALKLTVAEDKDQLSEGHEFHLGYLMVAG